MAPSLASAPELQKKIFLWPEYFVIFQLILAALPEKEIAYMDKFLALSG